MAGCGDKVTVAVCAGRREPAWRQQGRPWVGDLRESSSEVFANRYLSVHFFNAATRRANSPLQATLDPITSWELDESGGDKDRMTTLATQRTNLE